MFHHPVELSQSAVVIGVISIGLATIVTALKPGFRLFKFAVLCFAFLFILGVGFYMGVQKGQGAPIVRANASSVKELLIPGSSYRFNHVVQTETGYLCLIQGQDGSFLHILVLDGLSREFPGNTFSIDKDGTVIPQDSFAQEARSGGF